MAKPLNRDHGYPLHVIVPGVIGARSVKWLDSINIIAEPCQVGMPFLFGYFINFLSSASVEQYSLYCFLAGVFHAKRQQNVSAICELG